MNQRRTNAWSIPPCCFIAVVCIAHLSRLVVRGEHAVRVVPPSLRRELQAVHDVPAVAVARWTTRGIAPLAGVWDEQAPAAAAANANGKTLRKPRTLMAVRSVTLHLGAGRDT